MKATVSAWARTETRPVTRNTIQIRGHREPLQIGKVPGLGLLTPWLTHVAAGLITVSLLVVQFIHVAEGSDNKLARASTKSVDPRGMEPGCLVGSVVFLGLLCHPFRRGHRRRALGHLDAPPTLAAKVSDDEVAESVQDAVPNWTRQLGGDLLLRTDGTGRTNDGITGAGSYSSYTKALVRLDLQSGRRCSALLVGPNLLAAAARASIIKPSTASRAGTG